VRLVVREWCLMRERMGANGYREVAKWLRGVDLNHRPLGYEPKDISNINNLQDAGGPRKTL
jgi:hypothetical protein